MPSVTLEEAQARLPELIERLKPGEALLILRDAHPIAQLVPLTAQQPRTPGNCKGMLTILAEDDDHLKDFAEYME